MVSFVIFMAVPRLRIRGPAAFVRVFRLSGLPGSLSGTRQVARGEIENAVHGSACTRPVSDQTHRFQHRSGLANDAAIVSRGRTHRRDNLPSGYPCQWRPRHSGTRGRRRSAIGVDSSISCSPLFLRRRFNTLIIIQLQPFSMMI